MSAAACPQITQADEAQAVAYELLNLKPVRQ
jgi:hypothetical protein